MTPPAQGHMVSKCQPRCDSSSCPWSQPPGSTTHCPQSPKSRMALGAPVGTGEDAHPEGPRPTFSYSGSPWTTILPLGGTFGSLQKYFCVTPGAGVGLAPSSWRGEPREASLHLATHSTAPQARPSGPEGQPHRGGEALRATSREENSGVHPTCKRLPSD